jgi:ribosomal-protein-alanine N-acetyltransferase
VYGAALVLPLETARLSLRPWQADDLPRYAELFSDPEVTRYTLAVTPERVLAFVAHFLHQWQEDGFGPFAAIDRQSGEWIGQIGLNRVAGWPDVDNVEVGFELKRSSWRQGLATEGAQACVGFGFEQAGLSRIIGVTNPANLASRRVLEKAGLTYQGLCAFPPGLESAWYRVDRARWARDAVASHGHRIASQGGQAPGRKRRDRGAQSQ